MNDELHLFEIVPAMQNSHLMLKLDFLQTLLKTASKSEKPYKNADFVRKIGFSFNNQYKTSPGLSQVFRGAKSIKLDALQKTLNNSKFSWNDIEKEIVYIKAGVRRGQIKPEFPIVIGKELGSIVGHVLGDGAISCRDNAVFFSNTNISLLKEFALNMEKVFNIEPRIWVQEKKATFEEKSKWKKRVKSLDEIEPGSPVGLFYPKICGVLLNKIFGEFAIGKNKRITEEILNASEEFKKAAIRAFYDDESNVGRNSGVIRLFQDRKEVLESIKFMLKELRINSKPMHFYVKKERPRFYFNICGLENLSKFEKAIGFTSKEKAEKLSIIIERLEGSKFRKLCNGETKAKLLAIVKKNNKLISLREIVPELVSISDKTRWNENTILKHLKQLVEEKAISEEKRGVKLFWFSPSNTYNDSLMGKRNI